MPEPWVYAKVVRISVGNQEVIKKLPSILSRGQNGCANIKGGGDNRLPHNYVRLITTMSTR